MPARRPNAPGMHSGHALVAQRNEISSGARGERPLERYFYARTARRHEEKEGSSEDKPASDRYKAGIAALGLSCVACFEALGSVYASAGAFPDL